jgi:hypothetical protein
MPKSAVVQRLRRHPCFAWLLLSALGVGLLGAVAAPESDMRPVLFSRVMQRVSAQPEFRERVLEGIREIPRFGEFLSPDMVERLRVLILGKEWQRVDHFPAMTVAALNRSVDAASGMAGKATKPLAPADLLDTAEYPLREAETIDLDHPATMPTYADDPETAQKQIGFNLTMGDGPDPKLAPMHAASRQLAAVLNRLAMNQATAPDAVAVLDGQRFTDDESLMQELIRSHHKIEITDDVYFANFGHLHEGGREVMMPFWIDTQIAVPASTRSLLLPVSHSEQEFHIRGPKWNADVSFYYGIDGKAEFRTMDSLNQSWVMHRTLFGYGEPQDIAHVVRLLSSAVRVYYGVRLAHPELPFGGYYRLGVCQDAGAALELILQGRTYLFPITHDRALFSRNASSDARDQEFLTAFDTIPSDRGSGMPPVDRVLGAVPTTEYRDILIPGLGSDLHRVELAHELGLTQRTHPLLTLLLLIVGAVGLLAITAWWLWRERRRRHHAERTVPT